MNRRRLMWAAAALTAAPAVAQTSDATQGSGLTLMIEPINAHDMVPQMLMTYLPTGWNLNIS